MDNYEIIEISEHFDDRGNVKKGIIYKNKDTNINNIAYVPSNNWNRHSIIENLIRSRYTQDEVEAILNNYTSKVNEWLTSTSNKYPVFPGDEEYDELQKWRSLSKEWADLILNNEK